LEKSETIKRHETDALKTMYYRPVKQTTDTTPRINITDFRRIGFLQPGRIVEGTATIHGITLKARSESVQTLVLNYTWQGVSITQRIGIISKPSNLAGELLFFACPGTGKPCRLIYQTIGNLYGFFGYDYLRRSLYYEAQRHTKTYKATGKLFTYEAKIDRLTAVRDQTHYKGKETKRTAQVKQWASRYDKANKQAWDDLFTAFQQQ
jgi:hypothetical protein